VSARVPADRVGLAGLCGPPSGGLGRGSGAARPGGGDTAELLPVPVAGPGLLTVSMVTSS